MMRYQIAEHLSTSRYSYLFDLIYPEDIFEELLSSSQTKDLLTLENLLATSVDTIVVIPESPGSFAELGAFANDEKLRNKLVCMIDEQYKKNKSFINKGPVKLIKNANKNGVVFFNPKDINGTIKRLYTSLRKTKKDNNTFSLDFDDKITLLQVDSFLLPIIYLLEPATKKTLVNIVLYATEDEKNALQTTLVALTTLVKKRFIELTPVGYKLTALGTDTFLAFRNTSKRIKTRSETNTLDELRLEILNLKNRNKRLRV